jgi:hypothetical protein
VDHAKYVLIGRALDDAALKRFSPETRFSLEQTSKWRAADPAELIQDQDFHHLDRLSLLMMNSITLQCPVGPHDDPGLASAVLRACNISKVGSVAVQCSLGHWAEYPCG